MRYAVRAIIAVFVASVWANPVRAEEYKTVPGGVRYQEIGTYDLARLERILTSDLQDFETTPMGVEFSVPQNAVKLYRVLYPTVIPEKNNQPTEASGLVAVPDVETAGRVFPLLSWQHGTVFTKTAVPSIPDESMETQLVLAQFAGNGYVVVGADYIGKGFSPEPDSYMVKESTAQACVDMLSAAKAVLADLGVETAGLFLSGWSQGSYSTMVFRNRLETQGVPVTAAATACTPSSPYMLITRWINNRSRYDAQWILGTVALLINSYEQYYDLPGLTGAAIKPDYAQSARDFYANKIGWSDVSGAWPQSSREFLQDKFAAESSTAANPFYRLLQANQAYQWRYSTPSRYYYGPNDEAIAPYIAQLPVAYQETLGGAEATAVFAGDNADHRGTFVFGLKDQKDWFDGWLNEKTSSTVREPGTVVR